MNLPSPLPWSAAQYTKFEAERTRPVRDLLAHVPDPSVAAAIDLGCGPGNSTEVLQQRYPDAEITGLDGSADMVAAARARLPGIRFDIGDIATWKLARPMDLILANASLQWVPDHASLLPMLMAALAPGGSLAIQIPVNLDEPTHRLMREIAADGPWAAKLEGAASARAARHDANWYYHLLRGTGAEIDLWSTTYYHPLAGGAAAVVEWLKGSGLRPFLAPLEETERGAYLDRYTEAIANAYPAETDGTVLLPFPRLFIVATR